MCLLFIHGSVAPCFRARLTWCFCRGVTVLPHSSSSSSMQAWVLSKDVQAGRVGATEVHMFEFKPNLQRMHRLLHKCLFQRNLSRVFVRLLREQQNSICSLEDGFNSAGIYWSAQIKHLYLCAYRSLNTEFNKKVLQVHTFHRVGGDACDSVCSVNTTAGSQSLKNPTPVKVLI